MVFKVVGFQLCIKFLVLEVVEQFLEKNPLPVHFYLYFFISAFFSSLFYLQSLNMNSVLVAPIAVFSFGLILCSFAVVGKVL